MLSRDQIELIHREIDEANTPQESAAFRALMDENGEARALEADLRQVAGLLGQAGAREPPPHLKRAILDALPQPARASPASEPAWRTLRTIIGRAVGGLKLGTEHLGETIMTKKAVLIGSAAVAVVLIVASIVTGWPPRGDEAGTIGGVEPAARYHGHAMTEADVTLKNPEIQTLFQNDQILQLVRSDVFREVMASQAFRDAMASQAFREAMASQAFREALASQAFREVMASDAFQALAQSQALSQAFLNEAMASHQM